MDWLWLVAGSGWALAAAAWVTARRLSRRVDVLAEQYWELKYEHGELKARVKSIAPTADDITAAQPPVRETFVPLASVKRTP